MYVYMCISVHVSHLHLYMYIFFHVFTYVDIGLDLLRESILALDVRRRIYL